MGSFFAATPNGWVRILVMLLVALAPASSIAERTAPSIKPNIVFILADDLGWRDTSPYGSTFCETPNIERLAKRGMMFLSAYAANPLCSPTRASILTGQYPARIGITAPVCHVPQVVLKKGLQKKASPGAKIIIAESVTRLDTNYFTLAKALKQAGYATGHFGKWHLGHPPYSPLQHGFDVDIPHTPAPGPVGSYLAPWKFAPTLARSAKPGEHIEDRMSEEAARFIRAHKDQPFYLNYWAFSVHSPHDAKDALVQKYIKKSDPRSPQHNPVYGAMVESLDDAVGKLLDTLDELNLASRTVVIFFSDNGGWTCTSGQPMPPGFEKVPITSNAPLRSGKASIYEGGTREPCIVVWPGKTEPATVSEALFSSVDFYPTLLEMCGLAPNSDLSLDGVSQVPTLLGKGPTRDRVFCHFPHGSDAQSVRIAGFKPSTSVRQGDWKLIRFYCDNPNQSDRYELYNLRDDIGETNNLARANPAKVKALSALIDEFLQSTDAVVPRKNPGYILHPRPAPPIRVGRSSN